MLLSDVAADAVEAVADVAVAAAVDDVDAVADVDVVADVDDVECRFGSAFCAHLEVRLRLSLRHRPPPLGSAAPPSVEAPLQHYSPLRGCVRTSHLCAAATAVAVAAVLGHAPASALGQVQLGPVRVQGRFHADGVEAGLDDGGENVQRLAVAAHAAHALQGDVVIPALESLRTDADQPQ